MITTMTSPRAAVTTCLFALLMLLPSATTALAQPKSHATLSTSLKPAEVQQGQDAEIQIVVDIDEGLHAQSNKPNEQTFIPLTVTP